MKYILFLFIVCLSLSSFAKDNIIGKVSHVFDGDTIYLNENRIRLEGIDCPELMQLCKDKNNKSYKCGESSTAFLKGLIQDKEISCINKGKDIYKRVLGICYIGELDINEELVRTGNAIATDYGDVDYKVAEIHAKDNKLGLWQGGFTTPHRWRMKFGKTKKYKL